MALLPPIPPITKDNEVPEQHEKMETSQKKKNRKRCEAETGISIGQQTPQLSVDTTLTTRNGGSDTHPPCAPAGGGRYPHASQGANELPHTSNKFPFMKKGSRSTDSSSPLTYPRNTKNSSKHCNKNGDETARAKASRRHSGMSHNSSSTSSSEEASRAGSSSSEAESLVIEEEEAANSKNNKKRKARLPVDSSRVGLESSSIDGTDSLPSPKTHSSQQQLLEDKKQPASTSLMNLARASSRREEEESRLTEEQDRAFVMEVFKNGLNMAAPSTITPFMKNVPVDLVGEKKFKDILKSHLQKFRTAAKYESNVASFMDEFDRFKAKVKAKESEAAAAKPARRQGHDEEDDSDTTSATSTPGALETSGSRAVLDTVLGTTDPDQLIGGSAAGYLSAKVMNNVSPRKYIGAAIHAPRLTEAEKKTDTGKQLMRVTGFLDFLGEFILKSRQGFDMKIDHDNPPFLLPGDSVELEEDAEEENSGEAPRQPPAGVAAARPHPPIQLQHGGDHYHLVEQHPQQQVILEQAAASSSCHIVYQQDSHHLPNHPREQLHAGPRQEQLPPEAVVSDNVTYYTNPFVPQPLMGTYHPTPPGHRTYDAHYRYWWNSYDTRHVTNDWVPHHATAAIATSWPLPPPHRQPSLEQPVVLPPQPDQATSERIDGGHFPEPSIPHAHGNPGPSFQPQQVNPPHALLPRLHDHWVNAAPPEPVPWRDAYGLQPLEVTHEFHGNHLNPSDSLRVADVLRRTFDDRQPEPTTSTPTTYPAPTTEQPPPAPQGSHNRRRRRHDEAFDDRHHRPHRRRRY